MKKHECDNGKLWEREVEQDREEREIVETGT
jgi:hypothetical protein